MNDSFEEIEVIRGDFKVVWEDIGEGVSGEFDPDRAGDEPLLRFSCYKLFHGDGVATEDFWEQIDDASYCTNMPVTASLQTLLRAAGRIMDIITNNENPKKELEWMSHISEDDFADKQPDPVMEQLGYRPDDNADVP